MLASRHLLSPSRFNNLVVGVEAQRTVDLLVLKAVAKPGFHVEQEELRPLIDGVVQWIRPTRRSTTLALTSSARVREMN